MPRHLMTARQAPNCSVPSVSSSPPRPEAQIRDGSLDHRFEDVAEAVTAAAVDKLTVANPAHLAIPP